ncbi:MAG: alpha/beta hydrolase [Micavibrio sp.]|nr:alpha/beta hydrolase [Micavibrio sp.]
MADVQTGLVLIPGFMTDETLWQYIQPTLEKIMPVTAADYGAGSTIESMAQHVINLCPPRFVLLGFSLGGYIAREVVYNIPDRVAGLVLIATSARPDSLEQNKRKSAAALASNPAGHFGGLSRSSIAASLHPARARDDALIENIRAMGQRLGQDAFMRQSAVGRSDDRTRINSLHCPTLVIAAADDKLRTLDEARELQNGISGASLEIIEASGHMIPLEQPQKLLHIITPWLQSRLTQGTAT